MASDVFARIRNEIRENERVRMANTGCSDLEENLLRTGNRNWDFLDDELVLSIDSNCSAHHVGTGREGSGRHGRALGVVMRLELGCKACSALKRAYILFNVTNGASNAPNAFCFVFLKRMETVPTVEYMLHLCLAANEGCGRCKAPKVSWMHIG